MEGGAVKPQAPPLKIGRGPPWRGIFRGADPPIHI
jgi:hypothetical protein